jgi:hypothetical protein
MCGELSHNHLMPSPLIRTQSTTRRSPRHDVELPCEVITQSCDEPLLRWASDMSADGAWFDTMCPLSIGEELVVCFKPGIWWRAEEITVFGEVTRISRGLRGGDDGPGMGLAFIDLTRHERFSLRKWLRPRPTIAPRRRVPGRMDDVMINVAASSPSPFASSPFASRIS